MQFVLTVSLYKHAALQYSGKYVCCLLSTYGIVYGAKCTLSFHLCLYISKRLLKYSTFSTLFACSHPLGTQIIYNFQTSKMHFNCKTVYYWHHTNFLCYTAKYSAFIIGNRFSAAHLRGFLGS